MAPENECPHPTHVDIVCPTCRARLHPRLKQAAYQVKCPDCYVQVNVPPLEQVVLRLEEEARLQRRDEVGTYGLASGEHPPRALPKSVTIVCKKCGARLDPKLKAEPRQVRCPDCHSPVAVPSLDEIERAAARQPKLAEIPKVRPYRMGEVPVKRPRLNTFHTEKGVEIRREPPAPPPKWTFFSNVFTFPWQSGTRSRWLVMSAGWTSTAFMAAVLVMLFGFLGSMFGVGVIFLGMPTVFTVLLTSAYTAACFMPVVTDTAAGNNKIETWPDPVWKDWAAQLIYVAFLALGASAVGFGVSKLAIQFTPWNGTAGIVATFIVFPVILLSSLEADSPFVPLTLPILRTLFTGWKWWLLFYLLSGLLWVAFLTAGGLLVVYVALPAVVAFGPIFAAVLLIYARLLGRLGWRVSWSEADDDD